MSPPELRSWSRTWLPRERGRRTRRTSSRTSIGASTDPHRPLAGPLRMGEDGDMDVERLRRLERFGDLDHHDLLAVARRVEEVVVAAGDLLIEEGALPYELFVIEEGTADVEHDGEVLASL